jgi:uncharacterized protein YutE (UPF0331/DUF86 family)
MRLATSELPENITVHNYGLVDTEALKSLISGGETYTAEFKRAINDSRIVEAVVSGQR